MLDGFGFGFVDLVREGVEGENGVIDGVGDEGEYGWNEGEMEV